MTTVHLEYARYKGTWHELLEKVNAASPRYVYGELAWTWSAYEEIIQAQDEKEEPLPGIFLRFWDENLLSQLKGAIVSELLAFGSANDAFWRIIRRNRDTFAGIRIVEAENGAIQVSGEPQPVKLWEPERFPFADKIGALRVPEELRDTLSMVSYVKAGVLMDWRIYANTPGKEEQ